MKDIDIAGVAREADRIFFPNRYADKLYDAYEALTGEEVPRPSGRKQKTVVGGKAYMSAKGRDIPRIVQRICALDPDARVVGVTGSEWCEETLDPTGSDTLWRPIGGWLGDVALLTTYEDLESVEAALSRSDDPLPVATIYPNLVDRSACNIVTGFPISGGSEIMPDTDGLAMPVVDLVSTGESRRANGLVVAERLMEAQVALVAGRWVA